MSDSRVFRFRTEPEPLLAFRPSRKVSPSELLHPPGRWRTLLTFTVVVVALLGSAFVTAYLVYQQNTEQRVREQLQHLLQKAELDEPDGYYRIIDILKKNADLLGREETGERIARYVLHLALSHGDVTALEHAAEACSLVETRFRWKGQYYRKVFEIARFLTENKFEQAQLESEKALIRFPHSDMLLYELSLARIHLGAWDAADATLEMASMLGKPSQIPILVERATLLRRRGNPMEALQVIDHVLHLSPRHPVALVEKQLCLQAIGKKYTLPSTENALPSVAVRGALLAAFSARDRADFASMVQACSQIPKTQPEAAWCYAHAAFVGPLDSQKFVSLIPKLEMFPFPDVPCLLADFYLSDFRLEMARPYMDICRKNRPGDLQGHAIRLLAAAVLDRDTISVQNICSAPSPAIIWPCLDAMVRLQMWDPIRTFVDAPFLSTQDREWLQTLLFTDAFALVTTTPPPLRDCSPRSRLLRRLWVSSAIAAGRESDAVDWSQYTFDACPADLHSRLDYMETLVVVGYIADAMKMLETFREINHPEGMFRVGKAALETNMNALAGFWDTMLKRRFPEDFRSSLLSAHIAWGSGQWKNFQEHLTISRRRAPDHPELMELEVQWEAHVGRIANIDAMLVSEPQPVAHTLYTWMKLARRIQSENVKAASRWRLAIARLWMQKQSFASASKVLVEYVKSLDPVVQRDEIWKTVQTLQQLPQLHPVACVFLYRYLYAENRQNPQALAYLERAVKLAPDNPEYRWLYGKHLVAQHPAKAAEQFRRILSMRPSVFSEEARVQLLSIAPEKP